jgi:hypothetical protein
MDSDSVNLGSNPSSPATQNVDISGKTAPGHPGHPGQTAHGGRTNVGTGDLRMLGARDGFAHALILVRHYIRVIDGSYAPRIHPRHVRKRQRRDAVLRPLKEIERRLAKSHAETQAAYALTCETNPTGATS